MDESYRCHSCVYVGGSSLFETVGPVECVLIYIVGVYLCPHISQSHRAPTPSNVRVTFFGLISIFMTYIDAGWFVQGASLIVGEYIVSLFDDMWYNVYIHTFPFLSSILLY